MRRKNVIVWKPEGPQNGLGDRLRCIASFLIVARRMDADIYFEWTENRMCPGKINECLQIPNVSFFEKGKNINNLDREYQQITEVSIQSSFHPRIAFRSYTKRFPEYTPETFEEFFEEWKMHISSIKIRSVIEEKAQELVDHYSGYEMIGIHVRLTDTVNTFKRIRTQNIKRFKRILREHVLWNAKDKNTVFVLAADNKRSTEEWIMFFKKHKIPFISHANQNDISWRDRGRATSLVDAVVDLTLLSRCEKVLCSQWSSFLFIAKYFGKIRDIKTLRPHFLNRGYLDRIFLPIFMKKKRILALNIQNPDYEDYDDVPHLR